MRKIILTLGLFLVGGAAALAQEMRMPLNADQAKWGPAPNAFPPGAQIAVVSGDPFKNGLYVVRLKMPPNYKFQLIIIQQLSTSPCFRVTSTSGWETNSTPKKGNSYMPAASLKPLLK